VGRYLEKAGCTLFLTLTVGISGALAAGLPLNYLDRDIGGTAFPASWTPQEIMLEEYRAITAVAPETRVRFRVRLDPAKSGKPLEALGVPTAQALGMPGDPDAVTHYELDLPFRPQEFTGSGRLDEPAFEQHVWETLNRFALDDASDFEGPVCGGYVEQTVVKVEILSPAIELSPEQPVDSEVTVEYICESKGWRMAKLGWHPVGTIAER